MSDAKDFFQNGSRWLRADFHLHTKADKEFQYDGEPNSFVKDYVDALVKAEINLGVITNHNKFDKAEYKALHDKASKQNICLLPGVELSVSEGANGVHVLIVFSESWLENGQDYINPFLTSMFTGKTAAQFENENGGSDKNIAQMVSELEKINRDYFLIFAHVEADKGLWKEVQGGRLSAWNDKSNRDVCSRTLGFQKVRTAIQRKNVKQWLGASYPAELEGSDPKKSDEIGRGEKCFIKLGAFTFDAVKFALLDHTNRLVLEGNCLRYKHSHIQSVEFQGGTLAGQTIFFSPELNTLIGIRGSGKSSIIEVLRYVLEIPLGKNPGDSKYKEELVRYTMGSGGKAVIHAINSFGKQYEIRRVFNEPAGVYVDGQLAPGISIRETILRKPLYFGQKDLSDTGEGFEKGLIDKLLNTRLDEIRKRIEEQKNIVSETVSRLQKIDTVAEEIDELEGIKKDTKEKLSFYAKHGLEEKLQKRLDFDSDMRIIERGNQLAHDFVEDIDELLAKYEDDLRSVSNYASKHNASLFQQYFAIYAKVIESLNAIKQCATSSRTAVVSLAKKQQELTGIRQGLVDEFAEIERKLAEQLKNTDSAGISSEDFLNLNSKLAKTTQSLEMLSKQGSLKDAVSQELTKELATLNDLWHEEFTLIKTVISESFDATSPLQLTCAYKGDTNAFLDFFKSIFKGTALRESTMKAVIDNPYPDFSAIYSNLKTISTTFFNSNPKAFTDCFQKNLKTLLTYQVPNRFTIMYQGKELQHHSLGQRASALMLFLLGQQDNDVIIIDQPEDDLDNQTIYENVIKMVCKIKPSVQFIFATHNPNIPVLGDAEQIHACTFQDEKLSLQSGSIDEPLQQKAIIGIMEGGKEAFEKRKERYQIWKS